MQVILIMLLATIGSVALILLCGISVWSFIYLFRRIIKKNDTQGKYLKNTSKDIIAVISVIVTIIVVALLIIYGLPIIIENKDWFNNLRKITK